MKLETFTRKTQNYKRVAAFKDLNSPGFAFFEFKKNKYFGSEHYLTYSTKFYIIPFLVKLQKL
jgi:hypothetical protein